MTNEQIKQKFKETYPDLMRGDTPLSPYFDIWEYAIETATNELQGELENWKSEWQEQVQKATDEGYARTLQTIQLTKAKEIIKKLIALNRKEWIYSDVREEAEQFLNSEVEK